MIREPHGGVLAVLGSRRSRGRRFLVTISDPRCAFSISVPVLPFCPMSCCSSAAAEMLDWHGSGMSVMEMSHRGKEFIGIADKAEADLRALLAIPADYKVLFLQGGAIAENAIVPMNLLARPHSRRLRQHRRMVEEVDQGGEEVLHGERRRVGRGPELHLRAGAASVEAHAATPPTCTSARNETIGGVEYQWTPDTGDVPLVADMSSHILSRVDRRREVRRDLRRRAEEHRSGRASRCVIVRDDLLDRALPITPSAFHWKEQAAADSMLNTPPTYAIYIAGLVFEWLLAQGGVAAIERANVAKAKLLYDYLDQTAFYREPGAQGRTARG